MEAIRIEKAYEPQVIRALVERAADPIAPWQAGFQGHFAKGAIPNGRRMAYSKLRIASSCSPAIL
jgi:hypothetical protein